MEARTVYSISCVPSGITSSFLSQRSLAVKSSSLKSTTWMQWILVTKRQYLGLCIISDLWCLAVCQFAHELFFLLFLLLLGFLYCNIVIITQRTGTITMQDRSSMKGSLPHQALGFVILVTSWKLHYLLKTTLLTENSALVLLHNYAFKFSNLVSFLF